MFKEKPLSPETEKQVESKIILQFMRHGKKESDEEKPDEEIRLTAEWRAQANLMGQTLEPQPEVSLAWGGPRKRTQETAYRVMMAKENLDPDASLEEIEKNISNELRVGRKMIVDERLSFNNSGPIGKKGDEAYYAGRYLPWLINKSDGMAIETGDRESSTYTRLAANMAEIIERYTKVGNNFNKIVAKTDKYEKFGNQLERYLGTHMGISECFVAKVLEKIDKKKKAEFLESIGGGFKETQGIKVEIVNKGDEQKISVTYELADKNGQIKQETIEVNYWDMIEETIVEGKRFEKDVEASMTPFARSHNSLQEFVKTGDEQDLEASRAAAREERSPELRNSIFLDIYKVTGDPKDLEESRAVVAELEEGSVNNFFARMQIAGVLALVGKPDEARAEAEKLRQHNYRSEAYLNIFMGTRDENDLKKSRQEAALSDPYERAKAFIKIGIITRDKKDFDTSFKIIESNKDVISESENLEETCIMLFHALKEIGEEKLLKKYANKRWGELGEIMARLY